MIDTHSVNSLGLILDIFGVILIWRFGLPEQVNRRGESALLLEQTDESEKAKAARYDKWSRCGLWLILGGFFLQLIGNWL